VNDLIGAAQDFERFGPKQAVRVGDDADDDAQLSAFSCQLSGFDSRVLIAHLLPGIENTEPMTLSNHWLDIFATLSVRPLPRQR
jgi:hypothetical protein